jgi:hypothetical protein
MKRKPIPHQTEFVVLNKHNQVFSGMKRGYYDWSDDWTQAKPLFKDGTQRLMEEHPHSELIELNDFIK